MSMKIKYIITAYILGVILTISFLSGLITYNKDLIALNHKIAIEINEKLDRNGQRVLANTETLERIKNLLGD